VSGGIFFRGETSFMTGLQIAPEIPVEEVFFLALLCYLVMNVYSALELWLARAVRPRAGAATPADSPNTRGGSERPRGGEPR
jgi:hypothetical protein